MRRKQTGTELKLFELDTLKYVTEDNIKDSIYYIGLYPERMSAADVTFARKSGLLNSSYEEFVLSKVALFYTLGGMTFTEYSFLLLTKQWIKTTFAGNISPKYNEPLLPFILEEIQKRERIAVSSFASEMDITLGTKYAPTILSNKDSLRYVAGLLRASNLVVIDDKDYVINPLASSIVDDIIKNKALLQSPAYCEEGEEFWNSLKHGFFDILTEKNKETYRKFYPNLVI